MKALSHRIVVDRGSVMQSSHVDSAGKARLKKAESNGAILLFKSLRQPFHFFDGREFYLPELCVYVCNVEIGWMLDGMDVMFFTFTFLITSIR